MEIFCLSKKDPKYPKLLKDLPEAPLKIYLKGNIDILDKPSFAIVGTRKCSQEGKEIAFRFARELALTGLNIVSGLAFGIDSAAHEGALEGKNGKTIAVLGSPLNNITPRSQEKLGQNILKNGGLIISEYKVGSTVFASNFRNRNRIIAGLSLGVLIVEAPFGSGSIITAQYAQKYNRPVFVIPGSISSKNYEAANDLIKKKKAHLTTTPKDIIDYFKKQSLFIPNDNQNYDNGDNVKRNKSNNDKLDRKIINILKEKAYTIDEIANKLKINVPNLLITISAMEISGQIKDIGNKRYIAVQ